MPKPDLIEGVSASLRQHDWLQQGQKSVTQLNVNNSQEAMNAACPHNMLHLTSVACLWIQLMGCSITWSATALASINL